MGNLQNGEIDWSNLMYTDDKDDIEKYLLKKGDKESSVEINPDIISDDDDENNIENEDEYFEYLNSNKNNNDEGESEDEEIEIGREVLRQTRP